LQGVWFSSSVQFCGEAVCDNQIAGFEPLEFRIQTGRHNEGGKLASGQIEASHRQRDQQGEGNDSDEDVGDDEPVAEPPQ
jgi:hypothetical protein